jgi:hypothetical protein
MRVTVAAAAAFVILGSSMAFALTEQECADRFRKADADGDGFVAGDEATRYLAAMRIWTVTPPQDGRLDYAAFVKQCRNDVFREAINDPGAPLKGANSFTEAQAKDRAAARGFVDISELKKDDAGVWRGTARLDGKAFGLAVDFKGNVVSEPR